MNFLKVYFNNFTFKPAYRNMHRIVQLRILPDEIKLEPILFLVKKIANSLNRNIGQY